MAKELIDKITKWVDQGMFKVLMYFMLLTSIWRMRIMTCIIKYVSYFNSVFALLSIWHIAVKAQFTTISWHHYLSILSPFLLVICDVRREEGARRNTSCKRYYSEVQVTSEVKGGKLSLPLCFLWHLYMHFYMQLTIFKKILNFLLSVFFCFSFWDLRWCHTEKFLHINF